MGNEYLRAFVIGSSCLVFLPYFFVVSRFKKEKFNYNYNSYTFTAPITLGLMNVISLFIANKFDLSKRNRFLLISILAPTFVLVSVIYFKIYNYTRKEWIRHIVSIYVFYFIVWNLIAYNLDKYV
jgi:hypothetical protein